MSPYLLLCDTAVHCQVGYYTEMQEFDSLYTAWRQFFQRLWI